MKQFTTVLAFACGVLAVSAAAPVWAQWQELAGMPTPRSETAAAYWDGRIYVAGGLGGMRSFEAYGIGANAWQGLAPMPGGRHHLMVAAHAGKIYVFGGADEQWRATDTAWAYDPDTDQWATLASMPEPRYAGAAVSLGAFVFAVGGDGPSGALLRYDPVRDAWQRLPASLQRREHTAAATLGGKLYLIGGRYRGAGELASTEVYDVEQQRWRYGPSLQTPRAGFGAVHLDNTIYALGGEVIMDGHETLATTELLKFGASRWQPGPRLPIALHGVPVVAAQGSLFVLGGSESAGAIVNRGRVFRYTHN